MWEHSEGRVFTCAYDNSNPHFHSRSGGNFQHNRYDGYRSYDYFIAGERCIFSLFLYAVLGEMWKIFVPYFFTPSLWLILEGGK